MAQRPWVEPRDVHGYTEIEEVKKRSGAKLAIDIRRAEEYVISYTGKRFDEGYEELPEKVRTAVLLLAEAYARGAADTSRGFKSETFDDYSYTAADKAVSDIASLDLGVLLDEYRTDSGSLELSLRAL